MPAPAKPAAKKTARKYSAASKKKAAPKKKRNSLTLPYALNYLSGFQNRTVFHDDQASGKHVSLNTVSRFTISTGTTSPKVLVFNPSMQGYYQTMFFDATGVQSVNLAPSPLSRIAATEPPVTSKTLLSSLRIINTTQSDMVGSSVRACIISSGLEPEWVNATSNDVTTNFASECIQFIRESSQTRTLSAHTLTDQREIILARASSSDAHTFKPFQNASSVAGFQSQWDAAKTYQSHNMVLILLEPSTNTNSYEISLGELTAARYSQTSILSSLAQPSPSSTPDFQKNLHNLVNSDDKVFQDPLIDLLNPNQKKKM